MELSINSINFAILIILHNLAFSFFSYIKDFSGYINFHNKKMSFKEYHPSKDIVAFSQSFKIKHIIL